MGLAVCDGRAGLGQFTDSRVRDATVQALANRVKIIHPDTRSEFETGTLLPCTVRIQLKSGMVLRQSVGPALGDRENPMPFDAIVGKYRECARGLLPEEKSERVLALIRNIEALPDLSELSSILTSGLQQ